MSPLVRSSFATFLGNSSAVAPQFSTLKQIAESLTASLRDASPMVVKAALNATASLLRAGLVMLGQKASATCLQKREPILSLQLAQLMAFCFKLHDCSCGNQERTQINSWFMYPCCPPCSQPTLTFCPCGKQYAPLSRQLWISWRHQTCKRVFVSMESSSWKFSACCS